jgi:pimeloyl-ACP methyl ester carboxylesterase
MQPVTYTDIQLGNRARDDGFHLATYQFDSGPAVVFVHGFPDLARGWHNQLPAVAAAGFHAIAPDMRGYGGSSCPGEISDYSIDELTGDLVALLDALGIEKEFFVGHDWGGFVTWAMPNLHPTRVAGNVAACTPYIPFPSVAVHNSAVNGDSDRQYVVWFQQDGIAAAHMDQNVATIVDSTMRTAPPLAEVYKAAFADGSFNINPFWPLGSAIAQLGEPILSSQDQKFYTAAFSKTGYRGGINWYRNIDQNAQAHPELDVAPIDTPCLMLTAELDSALRPEFAADMPDRCSNLEMHMIRNAGHWVQQEQKEIFNDHLISWLQKHFSITAG